MCPHNLELSERTQKINNFDVYLAALVTILNMDLDLYKRRGPSKLHNNLQDAADLLPSCLRTNWLLPGLSTYGAIHLSWY